VANRNPTKPAADAKLRVDRDLLAARERYPQNLPLTHIALLSGWELKLGLANGVLAGCTPEEFEHLPPLLKQLEANRVHAKASLVMDRGGQSELDEDDRERLTRRALGILPTEESARLLEVASCPDFSPGFIASSPERFVQAITVVESDVGQASALAYGFLLMAGVRSNDDLRKYGDRIEELFAAVAMSDPVQRQLESMNKSGLISLTDEARERIVRAARDRLWQLTGVRVGQAFLFTQVLDGYLSLRPGGIGDDLGLAVADGIVVAKLGFPVSFLLVGGRVYLEITMSERKRELWYAFDRSPVASLPDALRLGTADLLVLGYGRLARGYANTRSHAHGARVARWVLSLNPDSAGAFQILGQCMLGLQRPAEAIDACQRALAIAPDLADAYLVQGNAYSLMNRWPEAIERYRQAIRFRSDYAEAYNNLGLALQRNGELEPAIVAYNEATRVRGDDYAEAWYNLGNLYFERAPTLATVAEQQAEYERATEAYGLATKYAPGFAGAHYNLGQAYYARKDLPAALAAYQAAVKANPKHAGAWHNMGVVYRDLGKPKLAVEAIEKAVTLNPILLR
jgi:tetratricopeptide (TPR) repeat protein